MKIEEYRVKRGILREHLVKELGVPRRTYQDWVSELRSPPPWVERLMDKIEKGGKLLCP